MGSMQQIAVLLGNGNGTFQPPLRFDIQNSSAGLIAHDLNGDRRPDLAVAHAQGAFSVLIGTGDGSFEEPTVYRMAGSQHNMGPWNIAALDLNHHRLPDLVVPNVGLTAVEVFGNTGAGFAAMPPFPTRPANAPQKHIYPYPQGLCVGDFDGDGLDDLAVTHRFNDDVAVLLRRYRRPSAPRTFLPPPTPVLVIADLYEVGVGPQDIAVADMNDNGALDLIVAHYGDPRLHVLLGHGDGTFERSATIGPGFYSVEVGDFNNDRRPDIVALDPTRDDGLIVYLNQ
jgi:FG-GAP-like repeat/FG-GAP repeat